MLCTNDHSMKDSIKNHVLIATSLVVLALAFIIGVWVAHHNQRVLEATLRIVLSDTQVSLIELAEITDRNGADETISKIVSDCAQRAEYEALLAKLSTLNKKSLIDFQNLSDACGSFYAERKALMVSKLETEYLQYRETADLLFLLTTHDRALYRLDEWSELVELEKTRSALLLEQKSIQEKIVSALIIGASTQSAEVLQLIEEAQDVGDLLGVNDRKVDERRTSLKNEHTQ